MNNEQTKFVQLPRDIVMPWDVPSTSPTDTKHQLVIVLITLHITYVAHTHGSVGATLEMRDTTE